jgi:hypothetical protein
MNIQYAYRVAASYDFNRDGVIDTFGLGKEIAFDRDAKKRTDWNRDGKVTVDEFAQSLARNDIYIGYDREVHSNNPYGQPGYGYPYPGGGSPYYPGQPGPITYPGSGYGYGNGGFGNIVGGAVVGGAIGYAADGRNGLETGAVIGGFIGALGNLFGN